jgi:hypothetical protein
VAEQDDDHDWPLLRAGQPAAAQPAKITEDFREGKHQRRAA